MKKLIAILFLLFTSQTASALCVPGVCTCTVTTTSVAFGSFNPLSGTSHDSDGNVAFKCGGVVGLLIPYTIAISKGGGTSYTTRRMASGSHYLNYNLYLDTTYSSIWGDGTGGSATTGGTIILDALGLFPALNHPVHGRVTAGQTTAVPGIYTDSITVTVTYY
jgi:spore coat protein U-like protein